jgi:hypothetical protein
MCNEKCANKDNKMLCQKCKRSYGDDYFTPVPEQQTRLFCCIEACLKDGMNVFVQWKNGKGSCVYTLSSIEGFRGSYASGYTIETAQICNVIARNQLKKGYTVVFVDKNRMLDYDMRIWTGVITRVYDDKIHVNIGCWLKLDERDCTFAIIACYKTCV